MYYEDVSHIRFSTRELLFFVTFVCISLGGVVSSGEAMPLVFLNVPVLAYAVLTTGSKLHAWLVAGVLAIPLLFVDVIGSPNGGLAVGWPKFLPEMWVAICLGATCGTIFGLRNAGKELLPVIVAGLAMVDFIWLVLPRIES